MQNADAKPRMPQFDALAVLKEARGEAIVLTTMGTAREWPKMSDHPLDLHYIPSAMGLGPSIGLGLAIARPRREVIVVSGDGSLLMNLGCLATIVASGARNITVVLIDNGIYEVTGGQRTVGCIAAVDYSGFATAAGFETVASFDDLLDWQDGASTMLTMPGPRFVALRVLPIEGDYHLDAPGPILARLENFRKALSAS